MIELVNQSGEVIKVPSGARKFYENRGFKPASIVDAVVAQAPVEEQDKIEKLLEKPIGQWKKDEVIAFANAKEIDITGTKNINEAKAIIKEFLESEDAEDWD